MKHILTPIMAIILLLPFGCTGEVEHTAEAISEEDSLPFMHAKGINTYISDSGVMRYHMVAEEWDIFNNNPGEPSTWRFMKGLVMERLDKQFHIDLHVQSDTAYLHKQHLWELRGRVVVKNINGDVFNTEELFWDIDTHEMWNHQYMHIKTPERELEGTEFRSNEEMTRYSVMNSIGTFPVSDTESEEKNDTAQATQPESPAPAKPNKPRSH